MAGILDRVKTILGAKANQALDAMEDPTQTIDYSYEKMQEALQETRRHIVEVATAKKQLESQLNGLNQRAAGYDRDAHDAVAAGRDDLATQALATKATIQQQIDELSTHIQSTEAEQAKLTDSQHQLEAKIETFRTQKEVMKAEYSAAKAHVAISESMHGITQHAEDISGTIDRAQDKIQQMQSRAAAIDEVAGDEPEALTAGSGPHDDIRRQLDAAKSSSAIQEELARIKGEVKGS